MTARPAGPLLLGVRHHGPGSARAVRAALDAARPQAVLIEGPPEGDALLPLAADEQMRPPVALLAHAVDDPGRAAFWPLAAFSPEWVAIRWALAHGVPVRFIDLPAAHSLAMAEEGEREPRPGQEIEPRPGQEQDEPGPGQDGEPRPGQEAEPRPVPVDPIRVLAETAGYDDPERWWEDVVEHRVPGLPGAAATDPLAAFAALGEAMTALREVYGDGGHPGTRSGRRTCASSSVPRARSSAAPSPWSAAPGTFPHSKPGRRRPPTGRSSRAFPRSRRS